MRTMDSVMPKFANHISQKVVKLNPDENYVVTEDNRKVFYDYLIVTAGTPVSSLSLRSRNSDELLRDPWAGKGVGGSRRCLYLPLPHPRKVLEDAVCSQRRRTLFHSAFNTHQVWGRTSKDHVAHRRPSSHRRIEGIPHSPPLLLLRPRTRSKSASSSRSLSFSPFQSMLPFWRSTARWARLFFLLTNGGAWRGDAEWV